MDLLEPAGLVERDLLDRQRVVEVGDGRVVEGDVPVLADAHADDVDLNSLQKGGIPAAGLVGIALGPDVVHAGEGHLAEDGGAQEVAEALRGVGREPHVFVHVEGVDAVPFDAGRGGEGRQELVLGGRGGENHVNLLLDGKQFPDAGGDVGRGGFSHVAAGVIDSDREFSRHECFSYHN